MDINNQDKSIDDQEVVPEPEQQKEVQAEPAQEEKKGATQRIRELSQQKKAGDEQIKSLQTRIDELTQPPEEQSEISVQPGSEISPEQYKQDVTKTADSIVKLRMKQFEAETRIKSETVDSIKTYPQLDPASAEFDQELSDTVTEAVEAHVRVNPYNATVKKFVDRLMKPYGKAIEKEVGEATEKIAKQVSEAAVRPTSVRKTEKTADEMTVAELEAKLGILNS